MLKLGWLLFSAALIKFDLIYVVVVSWPNLNYLPQLLSVIVST